MSWLSRPLVNPVVVPVDKHPNRDLVIGTSYFAELDLAHEHTPMPWAIYEVKAARSVRADDDASCFWVANREHAATLVALFDRAAEAASA